MDNAGRQVTVTKAELTAALRRWDERAAENKWEGRPDDPSRHEQNADYLMDLIEKGPRV